MPRPTAPGSGPSGGTSRAARPHLPRRYWDDYALVVEIEGAHHDSPGNAIDDSLRQNDLTIGHDKVLRIPVLGLRTLPDEFMAQVERALRAAGWSHAA